jgi:putative transposase
MPWKAASVADQRVEFVLEYNKRVRTKELTMLALCESQGVSPKSGHKWIARFDEEGWSGLRDRSRAPRSGLHWTDPEIVSTILDVRHLFPSWGARKILDYLSDLEPERPWPAASVAHEWLKRAGLVVHSSRARRFPHPGAPPSIEFTRPNQQWSIDFKGHFRTGDRKYCYPLTLADSFSRYILGCQALETTSFEKTWPVLERLFREYGLPDALLSDNGTPFSSNSVKRLSKLSVRLLRLGIEPRLIQPGKPQQNGRHERMHKTLKAEACQSPARTWRLQQPRFDTFVDEFNHVRPHEALGGKPPSTIYTPSERRLPKKLPEIQYPADHEERRVRSSGEIKWQGQWLFLSDALIGERVAFHRIDDETSMLKFAFLELGYYSHREQRLHLDREHPTKQSK